MLELNPSPLPWVSDAIWTTLIIAIAGIWAWLSKRFLEDRADDRREQRVHLQDALQTQHHNHVEALRREGDRHDWLAVEHRELVYKATMAALAARHAIWEMQLTDDTTTTQPGYLALTEYQQAYRRAKVLSGKAYDDACELVHRALVSALVDRKLATTSPRQGLVEAQRNLQAVQQLEEFDRDLWPVLVQATRYELSHPLALDEPVNPLVVKAP